MSPRSRTLWIPRIGLVFAAAAAASGCGGGKEVWEQKLGEVEREVARLRATNASLEGRLEALEASEDGIDLDQVVASDSTDDRPTLRVVELKPPPAIEETQESAPAPLAAPPETTALQIRGDGARIEVAEGKR